MAAATAAFRDSHRELMGIFTVPPQAARASPLSPRPSLPIRITPRLMSAARASAVSSRRAAPHRGRSASRSRGSSSPRAQVHTGRRNTAPMEARTVLGP